MKSAKQKGSRLEYKIAEYYQKYSLDKSATRMPLSGAIDGWKGDIKKASDGYVDECKNQERIQIWKWWEQTKSQCRPKIEKPVLHFTSNHKDNLTTMRTEDWFEMRKELKEWKDVAENIDNMAELPKDLKWKLKRTSDACKDAIRELSKLQ